jgi:hypothetical protein
VAGVFAKNFLVALGVRKALILMTRQRSLSRSNSSSHHGIIVLLSEFGGMGKSTASAERGTHIGPAYRAN